MGWSMAVFRVARRVAVAALATMLSGEASAQYIGSEAPPALPSAPTGSERPSDALARNVRILAQNPRDYRALIGAGRAALATGDPEAAVGFFGRAAEVSPAAPAPRAGTGAALVAMGEASHALAEFDRAQRLGAPLSSFASDRGLARDLLGQQALAQADYRLALNGPDASEARRRLALSLAITGNRTEAMSTLAPLLQHSDVGTNRVRAFVLALGGDTPAADRALDNSVPGLSAQLDPFFRRLPSLSAAQKAAAVHLGIFPGNGSPAALASAIPLYVPPTAPPSVAPVRRSIGTPTYSSSTQPASGNRLAEIDALLARPPAALGERQGPEIGPTTSTAVPPPQLAVRAPVTPGFTATAPLRSPAASTTPAVLAPRRVWVQLGSSTSEAGLSSQFARIAARDPEMFAGIKPWVSEVDGRTKLLVGPFKNVTDSETFVENLGQTRIDGFSWTSPEGQVVRRLGTQ